MIEDDLRSAFARHEPLTPPAGPLRAAIDRAVQHRRRRRSRIRATGAALALLLVAAVGIPFATVDRDRVPAERANLLNMKPPALPVGPLNLLLLGLDGSVGEGPLRADSVLIVHLPADRSGVYLFSLPRDLVVPVPGHGVDKLNTAFVHGSGAGDDRSGGWELTRRVVTDLTGLRIDAGAALTYPALRMLTDEMGGVPVCLPQEVRSAHTRRVFPAGCQSLDGTAAVDLLRERRSLPDGAQGRDRNAQIFAGALLRRVGERKLLSDPVGLLTLLRLVGDHLTVRTGELDLGTLVGEAPRMAATDPVSIDLPSAPIDAPEHPGLRLDATVCDAFFAALRADRAAQWVRANPGRATVQRQVAPQR